MGTVRTVGESWADTIATLTPKTSQRGTSYWIGRLDDGRTVYLFEDSHRPGDFILKAKRPPATAQHRTPRDVREGELEAARQAREAAERDR